MEQVSTRWYSQLYVQVLIGIVIGGAIGFFLPDIGAKLQPLADGFIKLIKMLLAPIIFGTVVVGIAKMGSVKEVGRIGAKALIYFEVLSTLALVAAMDMTNGGLYASIMQQYGSKEEAGAFVLMSLESGPLMTMVILGTAGIASFEPHVFVGAVLPFIVGFALGNLDPELRDFFGKAVHTLIPFFAFALGNTINLGVIAETGLLGIMLGVSVIIITGIPLILTDRLIGGGDGTAGIAASSTAGAAVATPVLIAEMLPQFKPIAPAATALVATSVIVTSVLVPIITAIYSKRVKRLHVAVEQRAAIK